jgi:O-antigen/teichoic acid export membrane protein
MRDLSRRVTVSAVSNVMRAVVAFATTSLLARWLGPEDYGRMSFLIASFLAFKSLLDMSTSSAFFTFLSQRNRGRKIILVYWTWLLMQGLLSVLVVSMILPDSILEQVWKGESRSLVVLALLATFMQYSVWPVASQMSEAQRETFKVQKITVALVTFHLFVVVLLWFFGELVLPAIFLATILEWGVCSWLAGRLYRIRSSEDEGTSADSLRGILCEFKVFCLPMIPLVWVTFFHNFLDRWLLQHYGGSVEQGYFSIASQFSAVSLIATSSVLNILWKEVAEANFSGDLEKVQRLYERTNRALFVIGALISGLFLPWTKDIINIMLGDKYVGGALAMSLMFLYPIHQSLGQVSGTMYLATGLTRPYVVIITCSMLLSSILAYFLLATQDAIIPGFGLASVGLALKMVLSQFVGVNILIWWMSRYRKWPFSFGYQLVGVLLFFSLGYASYFVSVSILPMNIYFLIKLFFSCCFYLPMSLLVIYYFPWLIGVGREEVKNSFILVKALLQRFLPN